MSSEAGPRSAGKRSRSALDDLVGLVDRERRLGQVGDALGIGRLDALGRAMSSTSRIDVGRLAERALDLLVALVADQEDRLALRGEAARLGVHLADERAGGVDHVEPALGGVRAHRGRDAVGREDDGRAVRHLVELVDEDAPRRSRSATTCSLWTICLRT